MLRHPHPEPPAALAAGTVRRRFEPVIADLEQQLSQGKVPRIREREEQRLEEPVDRFHDMLADLTDDFIDIIRERVHRDGG